MTVISRRPIHTGEIPEDLVTVEAIVRLGWCTRSKLDARIARGVIPSYKADGTIRVSLSETKCILESLGEKTGGEEGIAINDISVEAYDRTARAILENIGVLDREQRLQLAGLLTGDFADESSEELV